MRISDWSSDVCSSDLYHNREDTRRSCRLLEPFQACRRQARSCVCRDAGCSRAEMRRKAGQRFYFDAGARSATKLVRGRTDALWARLNLSAAGRSEEHTSELQSLMRISYAVFCLKKKK